MLRWVLKILLVLIALTVVAAGLVQLALRSDWLGEHVLARASETLGLDVSAESFTAGWGGTTILRGVAIRLPLRDEVLVTADRLKLGHTAVVPLLLGRPLRVRSVEIDHPTVDLQEYENGRWNVQDAWTRLHARLASRDSPSRVAQLPRVLVREGAIRIHASAGATDTVSPIEFDGRREQRLVWQFDLRAASLLRLQGQLSPGGAWPHEIAFTGKEWGPLLRDTFHREMTAAQVAGRWAGQVRQGALEGTLALEPLMLGPMALRGRARIVAQGDRVIVSPRGLSVEEPNVAGEPLRLTGGTIEVSRAGVVWSDLVAAAGAVGGQLGGRWDWSARHGELSGSWAAAWPDRSTRCYGTCRVSLDSPPEGRQEGVLSLTARAETPLGSWRLATELQGAGTTWPTSQWRIRVPTFTWSRGDEHIEVADVGAQVDLQWPAVQLTSLQVPPARQVNAAARFDADTRRWSAHLALTQLHLETLGPRGLDLRLSAGGDEQTARVMELRLTQGDRVVTAKGEISLREGELRNVHAAADWPAPASAPASGATPAGRWHVETDVAGSLRPLAVTAQGTLAGQNILLGRHRLERVQVPVHAKVDARQVRLATDPFDLLGGQWQLDGRYQFVSRWTRLRVEATNLSLEAAAGIAGLPLTSRGYGQAEVHLEMPGFRLNEAVAVGSWSAREVDLPPFAAEQAHGSLRVADGLVRMEDIQLEQEGGTGWARLEFRLDQPEVLSTELRTEAWPLRFADGSWVVRTDAQAALRLDASRKTADGEARVAGGVWWGDRKLGDLHLAASVQGRTLDVRQLQAATLGGSLEGTARVPLDRWTGSVARLRWEGIEPGRLAAWLPAFEPFQGAVSGTLAVEQTQGQPRALEPLRLVVDVNTTAARFGPGAIEGGRLVGYLGPKRLLVEDARIGVLGGRVSARARVSTHRGRDFGLVTADFNDLSLDQLVHVLTPKADAYPGQLSGSLVLLPVFGPRRGRPALESQAGYPQGDSALTARGNGIGSSARPANTLSPAFGLSGEARIRLTESDLVNNSIVRTLYNTLSLRFGKQEPTGSGDVRVRLEGPALVISSFAYSNRGVEIRGAGTVADFARGGSSPVEGYAVASTHILAGLPLPGVAALDQLLATFQTGAASVRIAGTLHVPQVKVVPLPEILGAFQNLLWAQLRE